MKNHALLLLSVAACAPANLSEALWKQQQRGVIPYPSGYHTLAPPSTASRLGHVVPELPKGTRRANFMTTEPGPCFTAVAWTGEAEIAKEQTLSWTGGAVVDGTFAGKVKAEGGGSAQADLRFLYLKSSEGMALPSPGPNCDVSGQTVYNVVTKQLRAEQVTLEFYRQGKAGVKVPLKLKSNLGAGWNREAEGTYKARHAFIMAGTTRIRPGYEKLADISLGDTPEDKSYPLTTSFGPAGSLHVFEYDAANEALTLTVDAEGVGVAQVSPLEEISMSGDKASIARETPHIFLSPSGDQGVRVRWTQEGDAIVVHPEYLVSKIEPPLE